MRLRSLVQHDRRIHLYFNSQYALVSLHGSVRQRAKHRRCFRETEKERLLQENRMGFRTVIRSDNGAVVFVVVRPCHRELPDPLPLSGVVRSSGTDREKQ